MAKVLKVLHKGVEVDFKKGLSYEAINTLKGIDGEIVGYEIWNPSCYHLSDCIVHVDLKNFDNSWSCSEDFTFKVVEEQVTLEKVENKQGAILNYTPHTVNIIDLEGNKIQDFPSMGEARCQQTTTAVGTIGNVPITSTTFGEVTGLPEEKENTYYIVSRLIRQALPNRNDLLVPNDMVRDLEGKIIGCKSLANN